MILLTFNVSLYLLPPSLTVTPSMDVILGLCPIAIDMHIRDRKLRFMPSYGRPDCHMGLGFQWPYSVWQGKRNKSFILPLHYRHPQSSRTSPCRTVVQSLALLANSTHRPNLLPRSSEPYYGYADSWNGCTEGRRVLLVRQRSRSRLRLLLRFCSHYALPAAGHMPCCPGLDAFGFLPPIRDVNTATDA